VEGAVNWADQEARGSIRRLFWLKGIEKGERAIGHLIRRTTTVEVFQVSGDHSNRRWLAATDAKGQLAKPLAVALRNWTQTQSKGT